MFTRNDAKHVGLTFDPCQTLLSMKSQAISLITFLLKNETDLQYTNSYDSYVGYGDFSFII